ncbi:hypothetical protein ACQPYK_08295 [Streptosporangium sp. CA-135522]|uniref:LuxE/PaaK family acyltransferase n=1 Tax=Streptosporangium sp. CA-135522 TaxID=3240072 RepID=UPI003D8DF6E7
MPGPNPRLTAVSPLQALLVCTRLWSAGAVIDEDAAARMREAALVDNHRRYATAIPAYAALVGGSPAATTTLTDIRDRFLVTDELFKSYDPAWLEGGSAELSRWLGSIFIERLTDLETDAGDLGRWRAALKRQGVYVTFSSGTGGRPSIVPRDRPTLAALRAASGVRLPWALEAGGYDFLQLLAPGLGLGIQSGATGLAAGAVRVHHLRATPFDLRSLTGPAPPRPVPDHDAAADFLARSERPVLVFGTPSEVSDLVDHLSSAGRRVPLPPGSRVVTGGGWKGRTAILREALVEGVAGRLGVPPDRCVDVYSTSELNTVFPTCVNGRYHVPPCVEPVVVDDLLTPVGGDDAEGRLAVLDPFALSYPGFIVTGDAVRLRRSRCGCGLTGPTLAAPIVRAAGAGERGCGTVDAAVDAVDGATDGTMDDAVDGIVRGTVP